MKELLLKIKDGEYIYNNSKMDTVPAHIESIEIPEGMNLAYKNLFGVHFTSLEMGYRDSILIWKRESVEEKKEEGKKFDLGKNRFSLLPKGSVNKIINVLEFGAKKYDVDNWQQVGNSKTRYYDATMRHIDSWWNGEKIDSETGIHHLAHAATNLLFLIWFDENESS